VGQFVYVLLVVYLCMATELQEHLDLNSVYSYYWPISRLISIPNMHKLLSKTAYEIWVCEKEVTYAHGVITIPDKDKSTTLVHELLASEPKYLPQHNFWNKLSSATNVQDGDV